MKRTIGLMLVAMLSAPMVARAQRGPDLAMRFFSAGGAYCFRLAPDGVALGDEPEWTVMVLMGAKSRQSSFRIRTVDPGMSGVRGAELKSAESSVTSVWRMDGTRSEFFERYAAAISGGAVRARVVKMAPPGLAAMTPRQRAEAYLRFSDKGEKVDFSKAADLTAEEFMSYQAHVPD
jgi:hypothetical protein